MIRLPSQVLTSIVVTPREADQLRRVPWWSDRYSVAQLRECTEKILGPERWAACLQAESMGMRISIVIDWTTDPCRVSASAPESPPAP